MVLRDFLPSCLLVLSFLFTSLPASARSSGWFVKTVTQEYEGLTLLSVYRDTLLCELEEWNDAIMAGRSAFIRIPLSDVVRIERSHSGAILKHMGSGLLIGGGMGLTTGFAVFHGQEMAGLAEVALGGAGAAIGLLIGTVSGGMASGSEIIPVFAIPLPERSALFEYVIVNDAAPSQ